MGKRPGARILTGFVTRTYQRRVHKHREWVFLLARCCHSVNVARKVPRHEQLICLQPFGENFLPGTGCLKAIVSPRLFQFRSQRFLVLLQVPEQFCRNACVKELLRLLAVVSGIRNHADFVLHLNQHDRMMDRVDLPDMLHQCGEYLRISLQVLIVEGGQDLERPALCVSRPRESLLIRLDPERNVARHAVLPGSEPEKDKLDVVLPCAFYSAVHEREIEPSLLGFDQFPVHRDEKRVEIHLDDFRPDRIQVLQVGCAGVSCFTREHEEGLAVDDQLRCVSLTLQTGDTAIERLSIDDH